MTKSLILVGMVALGASSATAQPPVVVTGNPAPSRIVSFDDLNIASKSGQARLVHRIRAAAKDLCLENNKEEIEFEAARRSCYKTAISGGFDQMNRAIAARESGASLAAATLTVRGH